MTKILMVEDNEVNREMLSRRLMKRGYEIVFAADGREAIVQAKACKPDVILMDVRLPNMDGLEATRHLKGDPETRAIPIIAVTAHSMDGDRELAKAAGCDGYESKPVDLASLIGKIEALRGKV